VAEKKQRAVQQILGEEAVLEMNDADVDAVFQHGRENMIKQAGEKRHGLYCLQISVVTFQQ